MSSKTPRAKAGLQLLVGFQGVTAEQELRGLIQEYAIGGIVLFKRNIVSPEQLHALLEEAQACAREILGRELWVAIDQEGGPVQRMGPPFVQLPAARELAARGAAAVVEWAGRAAEELRRMGIRNNLAPVLDVMPEHGEHFMTARALGSDPGEVARLGRLWIETLQQHGVSATAKHYPGLGRARSDPHHFAPVIHWASEEQLQRDLLPFREAIAAGVHCVMTSHAKYPFLDAEWPATLSPAINHDWLRRRLHFEGVLLSDDMDMAAMAAHFTWEEMVRQGLLASIDFFLLCQHSERIEPFYRALRDGIEGDSDLAAAHRKAIGRIEGLVGKSLGLGAKG